MNAEELITRFNNTAGGLIIFVAIAIIIFCALLWYYFAYFAYSLKNTVSAVIGTHTHVQTRDAQILNTGVLYISDVGMCGSYNSVLGTEINSVIERIIKHNENSRFEYLDNDDRLFSAVILKFNDLTFKGEEIIPLYIINKKG